MSEKIYCANIVDSQVLAKILRNPPPIKGGYRFLALKRVLPHCKYSFRCYLPLKLGLCAEPCKIACERCGERFLLNEICIHHKDSQHENNNIDNLQFLCKQCHSTTITKLSTGRNQSNLGDKIKAFLKKQKKPIWTTELAKQMKILRTTVLYHTIGQIKNGRPYGRDAPVEVIEVQGANKLIKLEKKGGTSGGK